MATPVIVPETARVHYDDLNGEYRVVTRVLSEATGDNEFLEVVKKVLSVAEVLAFILESFVAPVSGASRAAAPVGDLHGLAADIIARYPSGTIAALPRVVANLPVPVEG